MHRSGLASPVLFCPVLLCLLLNQFLSLCGVLRAYSTTSMEPFVPVIFEGANPGFAKSRSESINPVTKVPTPVG